MTMGTAKNDSPSAKVDINWFIISEEKVGQYIPLDISMIFFPSLRIEGNIVFERFS